MQCFLCLIGLLLSFNANAAPQIWPPDDPARFLKVLFSIVNSDRVQDAKFVQKSLGAIFIEKQADYNDNWCGPYDNAYYQDIKYASRDSGQSLGDVISYNARNWFPCPASPRNHPPDAPYTTAELWLNNLQSLICLTPDMVRSTGKVQVKQGLPLPAKRTYVPADATMPFGFSVEATRIQADATSSSAQTAVAFRWFPDQHCVQQVEISSVNRRAASERP